MKKYILILFSIISFWSCTEDESIDITVLPSVTTTGANTFGCLMDGWIYVGGRYLNWGHSYVWTYDSFHYYPEEDKLSVNVSVKPDINIHFIIFYNSGEIRNHKGQLYEAQTLIHTAETQ